MIDLATAFSQALGEDVHTWLQDRRSHGRSWREIRHELTRATGINVSHETLRQWHTQNTSHDYITYWVTQTEDIFIATCDAVDAWEPTDRDNWDTHITGTAIKETDASGAAVDMTGSGEGTASSVFNSVELQAIDYRERYRMCEDAIMEVVFPRWVLGAIRADLANRNGVDMLAVTNGMIADWFNLRNIRVQFVSDWQAGFDGDPIGDPDTVNYLLYAP